MSFCKSADWDWCGVEKRGCPGCYFDNDKNRFKSSIKEDIKTMKVMVSIPMSGRLSTWYENEMETIRKEFKKLNIEVVDSLIEEDCPYNCNKGVWYMARSLDILSTVNAVFFHEQWHESKGCQFERKICEEYGVKILDWEFLFPKKEVYRRALDSDRTTELKDRPYPWGVNSNAFYIEDDNHIPRID